MTCSRGVAALLVLLTVAGLTGCDRIREAIDDIRRSTGEQWERGGRRLP